MLNMEHSVSYWLNLDEIIYLSAAQNDPPKTLFGLRNKPSLTEQAGQPEMKWSEVKQSLLEKQIIWVKNGQLTLCSDILGQMIHTISKPKALVAIRPYAESAKSVLTRLYVRGGFTVIIDDDPHSENYYLLRAHTSYSQVQNLLEETTYFGETEYKPSTASITIDIPTLEKLMGAVKEADSSAVYNMCSGKGLSTELALDLYDALYAKKHLTSYVVYAFDSVYNDGRRPAHEVLLYGGEFYMWKIKLSPNEAEISATNRKSVIDDMRVISRLMDFV